MRKSREGECNAMCYNIRTYGSISDVLNALQSSKVFKACKAIVHNRDKKNGTDELVEEHIHIVLQLKDRRLISTIRNLVWKGNNRQQVHIEKTKDTELSVRYLQHLDEPIEKVRYEDSEVITVGDFDSDEMNKWLYMLEDLEKGTSPKRMLMKYGKEFLRNFSNLREILFFQRDWELKHPQEHLEVVNEDTTPFDEEQLSFEDTFKD